jgi:glutamyl-tRNA reductase
MAEAAVLSTCNRTEIYVAAADVPVALERATQHLLAVTGVPPGRAAGVLEPRLHVEAARHLCAVAAGLRSLAVGETQILTQVREAFEYAAARRVAGSELQALARVAVLCGKRVRAQTTLGSADTSVSALAVQLAQRRLGGLRGRTALLLGAGRINEVSAQQLREAGVSTLLIVSRTREAAARLAALCGGHAGAMEDLPTLLAQADLAIAATRAPQPPIVAATILPRAPHRPLLLYDLAVPRDVDRAVGELPHVELVDLDGLRAAPQEESTPGGTAAAWAIVDEAVQRYVVEVHMRRAVPLIAALRAHVDRQKEAELARTLASLEHLAPADREVVALLAHRLVNRMFHHLATRLKLVATEPDAEVYLAALAFLFDGTGTDYRTMTAPEVELGHDDACQRSAGPLDARGAGSQRLSMTS